MSASDISGLFKWFGAQPDRYKEVVTEEDRDASARRWPSLSKDTPVSAESVAPVVPLIPPIERVDERASPDAVADIPLTEQGAPASESSWPADSLQSLLGALAKATAEAVAVAEAPKPCADLSNIHVIAVISAKGGVGKSTLTACLAAALKSQGRSVLAVDLDPQNALYHHFGPAQAVVEVGLARGGVENLPWRELCLPIEGVGVLPYGPLDEKVRRTFEGLLDDSPEWLAQRLAELELSDGAVVILDTPPGPSVYLRQALQVANEALVVALPDAASYTTLPMVDGLIREYTAGRDDFLGARYVVNQLDCSRQLSKDILSIMRNILGDRLLGVVHRDQAICEALAYNRSVLDYAPQGQGCLDILACARAIAERIDSRTLAERRA